jgi:hypothetical protein
MTATMECAECGAQFYSAAWRLLLRNDERCTCGGMLAHPQPAVAPPAESGENEGKAGSESGEIGTTFEPSTHSGRPGRASHEAG